MTSALARAAKVKRDEPLIDRLRTEERRAEVYQDLLPMLSPVWRDSAHAMAYAAGDHDAAVHLWLRLKEACAIAPELVGQLFTEAIAREGAK